MKEGVEMTAPSIIRNEQGLTLLELLLSITLIGIVLFTFMGFFTQNAIFIQNNEKKLSTSETAQKVINHIESNFKKADLFNSGIINSNGTVVNGSFITTSDVTPNEFIPTPIDPSHLITVEISNFTKDSSLIFIQVKVTVQDMDKPNNQSETFTFIKG